MPVIDAKFSTFADGGDLEVDDIVVGLRAGVNTRFSFQGTPGLYLPLAGGTMAGGIDMDNNQITGAPAPVANSDLANKLYVDITAGGTGTVSAGLINQVAWYAASGTTVSGLATAANGLLVTSAGSVPSISTDIPTAVTIGGAYIYRVGGTDVAATDGGTGIGTYALGDTLYSSVANTLAKLAGNITTAKQYLSQTGTGAVSAAPAWATIDGGDITGAALSKVDDTNVTLTLGGTPTTALLRATSLTLGWTGQLSLTRGGSNASLTASDGGIVYSTATAMAILAGTATARQIILSGASTAPTWSPYQLPATAGTVGNVLKSDGTNFVSAADTPGALTQNHIYVGDASNVAQDVAMSGDATIVASGALTIVNNAVTNAKLAEMATLTIKGNNTGGTTEPLDLTVAEVNAMLGIGTNVTITDDTTTNATMYPTWVTANTGSLPLKVTSTKLFYNPSTSLLTNIGALAQITNIQSSAGLEALSFSYTASAVNEVTVTNAATGNAPSLNATGDNTNITLQLNGKGTGGAAVEGSSTNDNAAAGYVGEVVTAQVLTSAGIAVTNTTITDITSISLTAGDWDVFPSGFFEFTNTSAYAFVWAHTTSASDVDGTLKGGGLFAAATIAQFATVAPMRRISLSATTTIYLTCRVSFTVGTATASGFITARRVR